ncbi:MAG: hypothetical protein AB1420_06495 [Bacillota bacterium]
MIFYFVWSQTTAGKKALEHGSGERKKEFKLEMPSPQEKAQLDKQFKWWRNIVGVAFLGVLLLYVIPFFI